MVAVFEAIFRIIACGVIGVAQASLALREAPLKHSPNARGIALLFSGCSAALPIVIVLQRFKGMLL